jgi:hypothetical protein
MFCDKDFKFSVDKFASKAKFNLLAPEWISRLSPSKPESYNDEERKGQKQTHRRTKAAQHKRILSRNSAQAAG